MAVPELAERAQEVHIAEYSFVTSLIPMYRGFQIQAVGFALVIYTAVLGLIGAKMGEPIFATVLIYSLCLLPYPISLLVLSFAVMEVRVRRAALFVAHSLRPALLQTFGPSAEHHGRLLRFELEPGLHLNALERQMSSSLLFVLVIAVPAAAGAAWLVAFGPVLSPGQCMLAVGGLILTIVTSLVASMISSKHELRRTVSAKSEAQKPSAEGAV